MKPQTQDAPAQGSIYDPAIALEFFKLYPRRGA